MSDDIAPAAPFTIPDLGVAMPVSSHRKSARRNAKAKAKAKSKHAPQRYRNAAPTPPPRPSALRRSATVPPEGATMTDKLVRLGETLVGAAAASVVGAYAVKWGFHPELVSYGLGAVGVFSATRQRDLVRLMGAGAASAAGSQLLLLKLNPPPAAPAVAAQPAQQPHPPQTAQLPKRANADLGSLPPGMLDAAFERARAELAVSGDGYAPVYDHMPHHIHHGPVYPGG
jgi:hypothetical protein